MAYQVIARKWRPQTFAEMVGQEHVTRTLENAIRENRVAHAYIFSGARGVGKTTTARILAKALNCVKGPATTPCNQCDACRDITAGTSLDVMEIDAASNRGIDQIRELREMVRYVPLTRKHRVVILDEAHMLTGEAANALLKTLEEPPEGVVFVMATTQPQDLSDTIRSRSQHFHFRALTFQEISGQIEKIAREEKLEIEPGALAVIARAAEGSVRDGLSVLEQAIAFCGPHITDDQVRQLLGIVAEDLLDELMEAIAAQSAERALGLVHRLLAEGHNLPHFSREAIRHVRNLLVTRVCGADSALISALPGERPRLERQAAQFSEEDLTRFFSILLGVDDDLRRKPDQRLHLEMGLLRLVNAGRLAPLEELFAELRPGTPPARPAEEAKARPAAAPAAARSSQAMAPRAPSSAGAEHDSAATPKQKSAQAGAQPERAAPIAMAPPSAVAQAAVAGNGLTMAQLDAIQNAIAGQHKMLAAMIEAARRWELEGNEIRVYFPRESRAIADMLNARDPLEKLRNITSQVLGQPLRVCVKLESSPGPAAPAPPARGGAELRRAIEQDPMVREMLARFGGQISRVRRREEE
jgi:DNA polymerase-3 subunit gamma/tau